MGLLTPTVLANAVLNQQIEIFEGGGVSLDSLWRASGSPSDRDPKCWVETAAPLIQGLSEYLSNIAADKNNADPAESPVVLWTWNAPSSEPWRKGDLMSNAWIAKIYAAFLED